MKSGSMSLPFCSFSRLFCLFGVLCNSIWILGSPCQFVPPPQKKRKQEFWRELCDESGGQFGECCHLNIFSMRYFFIYFHFLWVGFHLFTSAMFCSFQCMSCTSFVKFITKYFFDDVINGIVFLILVLDFSLLVYKHTTDFCILILDSNLAGLIY